MIDYEKVYRLNCISRYNTQIRLKDESVASHSYFVAYFAQKLCTLHGLSDTIRLYSMEAAIMHDIPEIDTNDITKDVKDKIPAISYLIKPLEEEIIEKESMVAYNVLFNPKTEEEFVANAIVKYADVLSVLQYCNNEVKLGNKGFNNLLINSQQRVEKEEVNLKNWIGVWKAKQKEGTKCRKIIN